MHLSKVRLNLLLSRSFRRAHFRATTGFVNNRAAQGEETQTATEEQRVPAASFPSWKPKDSLRFPRVTPVTDGLLADKGTTFCHLAALRMASQRLLDKETLHKEMLTL